MLLPTVSVICSLCSSSSGDTGMCSYCIRGMCICAENAKIGSKCLYKFQLHAFKRCFSVLDDFVLVYLCIKLLKAGD